MGKVDRIDKKLRKYRSLLAEYRRLSKAVEEDFKDNRIGRDQYRKRKEKYEAKIRKLLPKIKELVEKRSKA